MLPKSHIDLMESALPIFNQFSYVKIVHRRDSEWHAFAAIRRFKYMLGKLDEYGIDVFEAFETVSNDSACVPY